MAPDRRQRLGRAGESLAVSTLEAAGLAILARNWRCAAGEIDIVAQEPAPDYSRGGEVVRWLVFVEVRLRRGRRYGTALQSITSRKQDTLRTVAQLYVQQQEWSGPWRIDVVAIQLDKSGRLLVVEHIRHAVGAE